MHKILLLPKTIFLDGKIFVSQKTIRIFVYLILPLLLCAILFTSFSTNGYAGLYSMSAEMAGIGFTLLFVSLYTRPLRVILPEFKILATLLAYRRQLGIATFYVLAGHGIGLIISLGLLSHITQIFSNPSSNLMWGILSLDILFILYLTSNNASLKKLKRNWKRVQRLVYLALLFAIMHTVFIGEYIYAMYGIVYVILTIMAWKKISFRFFSNI